MRLTGISRIALFAAFCFSAVAIAQETDGSADSAAIGARWWSNPRVVTRLGLTAEQQKKIDEITYASGQKLIDLRAELDKARLELSRLLQAETLDDAAIDKAAERSVQAQTGIFREELRSRADVARALTRDQRVQLISLFEQRSRVLDRVRQRPMRQR